MGAGHDGAARELQQRLRRSGHVAEVVDFLECCPFGIGWLIKWSYIAQLRFAPWSYELTYRLWYKLPSTWGFIVRLDTLVAAKRLQRAIERLDADVVVSTYPLSSLVLGNLRRKGWLKVPVVTFLTDFAVHPLWVHPDVDLHVATSPYAARAAAERAGGEALAPGPLVSERFRSPARDRAAARRRLGLAPCDRAVLVVAGSWGVGDVLGTVEAIARSGRYHPVTVCGRDEKLKLALEERGLGTVIGWTDEMPALMATCDAMVENAGGLTANEAFAAGLPVVTFKPIAGHGRDNAEGMAAFGVTRYAHDEAELHTALDAVTTPGPERDAQVSTARALFAGDAKEDVLTLATRREADGVVVPIRVPAAPRRLRTTAAAIALVYGGLTLGAQGVAALGVGVARPPRSDTSRAYIGARLTADQLADPAVVAELEQLHATAIVDGRTARHAPVALQHLRADGVDVANGGWGTGRPFRYLRARTDVATTGDVIRREGGGRVHEFVPERRVDAFDQFFSRRRRQRLVEADKVVRPDDVPAHLRHGKVYVLDGRHRDPAAVQVALADLASAVSNSGLRPGPLSRLR